MCHKGQCTMPFLAVKSSFCEKNFHLLERVKNSSQNGEREWNVIPHRVHLPCMVQNDFLHLFSSVPDRSWSSVRTPASPATWTRPPSCFEPSWMVICAVNWSAQKVRFRWLLSCIRSSMTPLLAMNERPMRELGWRQKYASPFLSSDNWISRVPRVIVSCIQKRYLELFRELLKTTFLGIPKKSWMPSRAPWPTSEP